MIPFSARDSTRPDKVRENEIESGRERERGGEIRTELGKGVGGRCY